MKSNYIVEQSCLFPEYEAEIIENWDSNSWETPDDIAKKMSSLVRDDDKLILEPSAGSGQIAQYLPQNSYCIELKKERVNKGLVKAPHCNWLHGSFLSFDTELKFDLIIGNPPFNLMMEFFEKSFELLNRSNLNSRVLFLLPLDFNCSKKRHKQWKERGYYIHTEYRIAGRVHYLGRHGTPEDQRQIYDGVFDIRLGEEKSIKFL